MELQPLVEGDGQAALCLLPLETPITPTLESPFLPDYRRLAIVTTQLASFASLVTADSTQGFPYDQQFNYLVQGVFRHAQEVVIEMGIQRGQQGPFGLVRLSDQKNHYFVMPLAVSRTTIYGIEIEGIGGSQEYRLAQFNYYFLGGDLRITGVVHQNPNCLSGTGCR